MIFSYLSVLLLLTGGPNAVATPRDSIGIYKTQQDYLDHRIDWISGPKAKIDVQPQFSQFPVNVDSGDILYLRQTGKYKERLRPDSVFGFIRKGVKYLYFSQERRYMAVLNDKLPLMLVLKADEHFNVGLSLSYTVDTLLYATAVGRPLKILNKGNILKDFGTNNELVTRLTLLSRAIIAEEYILDVNQKDFTGYRLLVHDYLYDPLPIRRRHYAHGIL